jgi:hypothetical protein
MGSLPMTWFADGSPYVYMGPSEQGLVNVGWLDAKHPFAQTIPDPDFLAMLLAKCAQPTNKTRGWHRCELCDATAPFVVKHNSRTLMLGGAEIRVEGRGLRFAAPDLIYHYVRDHHYRPPDDFNVALRKELRG